MATRSDPVEVSIDERNFDLRSYRLNRRLDRSPRIVRNATGLGDRVPARMSHTAPLLLGSCPWAHTVQVSPGVSVGASGSRGFLGSCPESRCLHVPPNIPNRSDSGIKMVMDLGAVAHVLEAAYVLWKCISEGFSIGDTLWVPCENVFMRPCPCRMTSSHWS